MNSEDLSEMLDSLGSYNVHAVVLFMEPTLVVQLFKLLRKNKIDVTQYVWIVSEIGFTTDPHLLNMYPTGTLLYRAVEPKNSPISSPSSSSSSSYSGSSKYESSSNSDYAGSSILNDVTLNIMRTASEIAEVDKTPPSLMGSINSITCLRNISGHSHHLKQGTKLYQHLKIKGLTLRMNGYKHALDFGADGFVSNAPYFLLNLVEGDNHRKEWKVKGHYIREVLHLNTIIWPGGSPRLPHSMRSIDTHKIRVVLKESLPFVMVTEQFSKTRADEEKCMDVGLLCLNVTTSDPEMIHKILNEEIKVKRVCCFGFTIDLIKQISNDLSLSYIAYLNAEQMVGSKINDTWRGMVGDVSRGSADMAAGATSITPERMEVVDFTVPYYSSAFGTLSARKDPEPKLGAFLDPFSLSMWVLIFIFVHITSVFIAMFEWLSPFGLHPLGRNRTKTFSFPSGLLHTWSVLFSHTYNSKPPKSVASRIIVNAWGMFAVVFIAGYTANLASFMAGRMLDPNIDISQLRYPARRLRFATIIGTSTEYYLKLYFPQKYKEFRKYNVLSLDEGVEKLKHYEIEALMFDAPMVDYKAATDPDCRLIAAGSNFWSDTYGLAFSHGSSLTTKVSSLIVKYEATGILTSWEKKWLNNKSECHSAFMSSYRLSVKHAGGVFVLIGIGVVASLFVLMIEWIIYKFVVPVLRKHKRHGRWKYIMFISQRLNSALQSSSSLASNQSVHGVGGGGGGNPSSGGNRRLTPRNANQTSTSEKVALTEMLTGNHHQNNINTILSSCDDNKLLTNIPIQNNKLASQVPLYYPDGSGRHSNMNSLNKSGNVFGRNKFGANLGPGESLYPHQQTGVPGNIVSRGSNSPSSPLPPAVGSCDRSLPYQHAPHPSTLAAVGATNQRNINRIANSGGTNDNYQPIIPLHIGATGGGGKSVGDQQQQLLMPATHQQYMHEADDEAYHSGMKITINPNPGMEDLGLTMVAPVPTDDPRCSRASVGVGVGAGAGDEGLMGQIRVSPVHTVLNDLKYTNFTCKPNSNLGGGGSHRGSQTSISQKHQQQQPQQHQQQHQHRMPPQHSGTHFYPLAGADNSPDSQHSPESQNMTTTGPVNNNNLQHQHINNPSPPPHLINNNKQISNNSASGVGGGRIVPSNPAAHPSHHHSNPHHHQQQQQRQQINNNSHSQLQATNTPAGGVYPPPSANGSVRTGIGSSSPHPHSTLPPPSGHTLPPHPHPPSTPSGAMMQRRKQQQQQQLAPGDPAVPMRPTTPQGRLSKPLGSGSSSSSWYPASSTNQNAASLNVTRPHKGHNPTSQFSDEDSSQLDASSSGAEINL
ncbi:uncharacterized protein LOC142348131 isoform X2 [Convolutriloba macropyga]|uniref:uncharacterized protein LOC142348131 isoform X2 n=1 Tax=Convolutriloba macropyga TaxID=536237 RepID=UPI003F522A27